LDVSLTAPVVVERHEQAYVCAPATVPMAALPVVLPGIFQEVATWARTRGLARGAPFIRYVRVEMDRDLDIEVGVPVPPGTRGDGGLVAGALPAGRYLKATHTGPYERLLDATARFLAFAEERGLAFDTSRGVRGEEWAARLEVYDTDPAVERDPEAWRTVLAFKLAD
jgi:effector-binding domain-containing protein